MLKMINICISIKTFSIKVTVKGKNNNDVLGD